MTEFKILLVENESKWEDILRGYIQQALTSIEHEKDSIEIATSFESARNALTNKGPYHLVVTDLKLTNERLDVAKELGKELVERACTLQVPTIVVSAYLTPLDTRDFFKINKVYDVFPKAGFVSRRKEFIEAIQQTLQPVSIPEVQKTLQQASEEANLSPILHNTHALLIGIAAYKHLRPLSKTTTDVQDLYNTLIQSGYSRSNIALLRDEQATKAAINEKLDWLSRRAGADDTVMLFFSGHGAQLAGGFWPGEYLCPVEAAPDSMTDTFISHAEFTSALQSIHAARLVVFLDACHAGGMGEPKDIGIQVKAGLSETTYDRLAEGKGRVIIASCRPSESSWELPDMRNGLFTHYLLEGMRQGAARQDGTVWINDLFTYVYKQVSQHSHHCPQHPFQKSAAEDFIIAVTKQFRSSYPYSA